MNMEEKEMQTDFCASIMDPDVDEHESEITKLIYKDPNEIDGDESE